MAQIKASTVMIAGFLTVGAVLLSAPIMAQSLTAKEIKIQVQDTLKECFQCHGKGGVSVIPSRPTLAGQHAEYLRRQLLAFKRAAAEGTFDGDVDADRKPGVKSGLEPGVRRSDPVMEHMAAGLPDHLISPIATAISQLACDGGLAKAKRAKPLRTKPLPFPPAARKCVVCHGEDGLGRQAQIPNLAGQQRSYLRRQLLLIRETSWGAHPRKGEAWRVHPIMEAQVARLKVTDIDTIGNYYAGLDCRSIQPQTTPK